MVNSPLICRQFWQANPSIQIYNDFKIHHASSFSAAIGFHPCLYTLAGGANHLSILAAVHAEGNTAAHSSEDEKDETPDPGDSSWNLPGDTGGISSADGTMWCRGVHRMESGGRRVVVDSTIIAYDLARILGTWWLPTEATT